MITQLYKSNVFGTILAMLGAENSYMTIP